MAITIRVEVTDGEGLTSSMEREGDLLGGRLRQLTMQDVSQFLETMLSSSRGRSVIRVRAEVTDEEGLTTSLEREGDLLLAMLRQLTIQDMLRFLDTELASLSTRDLDEYEAEERPKVLRDCIVEAIKDFLNKKGYRVRSVKRNTDNVIFILRHPKAGR